MESLLAAGCSTLSFCVAMIEEAIIGQVGLSFDSSVGLFTLFIVLPTLFLFGCFFGGLAIVTDSPSWWKPWALSIASIMSSAILFYFTLGLDHGFTLGTLLGLVPGLLGIWAVAQSLSHEQSRIAGTFQFSTIAILRLILCTAIALAIMKILDEETRSRQRALQVVQLLAHAKMLLATPAMPDADSKAIATLGFGADKAIELCNQAIELAPKHGEAYHIRAIAYQQKGDLRRVNQDRLRAIEFGYSAAAPSDKEEADESEPD